MRIILPWGILILKGSLIGLANLIPGVSGGTLAVTLGIYEPLVQTIAKLPTSLKTKNFWKQDLGFLTPLGIGMILSFAVLSKVITVVLAKYPVYSQLFFIGLIVGSIPLLLKLGQFRSGRFATVCSFLFGLGLMLVFFLCDRHMHNSSSLSLTIGNADLSQPWYLVWLWFCGVLAAVAMVLPGISGSLVLVMLGTYGPVLQLITAFTTKLFLPLEQGELRFSLVCIGLALFAFGVLVGILLATRLINWLLTRYKTCTLAFILGLLIGSILPLWPMHFSWGSVQVLSIACIVTLLGGIFSYVLSR